MTALADREDANKRALPYGWAFFFLTMVLFAGNNVAVHFSNLELQPMWGATLRLAISSLILWIGIGVAHMGIPRGKMMMGSVVYGFFLLGINIPLFYWGLLEVSPATASVIYASIPAMTVLLVGLTGRPLRLEERTRWSALIGALVALFGISVVFADSLSLHLPASSVACLVLGAMSVSFAGVLLKTKTMENAERMPLVAISTTVATCMVLPLALLMGERLVLPAELTTQESLIWLVFGTTLGYYSLSVLYKKWIASKASFVNVLTPLVTIAASSVLSIGEITPYFLAGTIIVLVGSWLALRG